MDKNILIPILRDKYIPDITKRLFEKIIKTKRKKIALIGFSEHLRWLNRLLKEVNIKPLLLDWRDKYKSYDCGGDTVKVFKELKKNYISKDYLFVVCVDEISLVKECSSYLFDSKYNKIDTIYDTKYKHNPFLYEEPYKSIRIKAYNRARSMIDNEQLFDLIQFIRMTKNVKGSVIEYGSLYGGSGAILAEAINFYGIKNLYLLDSFKGIPKSKYGLDYCWDGAFSDNSEKMVKNSFADLKNVKVIPGNIEKTYNKIKGPFSFVYLASDTLESCETIINYIWPKLSKGGIVCVCDYGSFPNAIPLTMYIDKFFSDKQNNVKIYYPKDGIFIIKDK